MTTRIEIIDDRSGSVPSDGGFLKVRRLRMRSHYADGSTSEVFPYDVVDREALDAVVMVLFAVRDDAPADPLVCVRSALRPPLALRHSRELVVPDPRTDAELWELPAGLIEAHEKGLDGVRACAAREALEETGFTLSATDFEVLGVPVFLSPGMCGEKIHIVCARVADPHAEVHAAGDGVLEVGATVAWWPLSECFARVAEGVIEDAKTELALHRFKARLARGG
ncbi:MAG: NUDIX hydrolase [Polyangiales bacterium]